MVPFEVFVADEDENDKKKDNQDEADKVKSKHNNKKTINETVPTEAVKRAIKHLHVGLGHASVPDTTRVLRHGGGNEAAFKALQEFVKESVEERAGHHHQEDRVSRRISHP